MDQYKISVHIPYYNPNREKKKITKLKKVCLSYLSLTKKTQVFVHTVNKSKDFNDKRIKFVFHTLKGKHPYMLTWVCRKLMFNQRNKFDVFIYSEDDILFTKKNFYYWLKYKDICIRNYYNLGFLRVEKKTNNKKLISSDQVKKIKYFCKIENTIFVKPENPYCAIWIYDSDEFKKFINSKYWNFHFKKKTISGDLLTREMSAYGWHSDTMNRYKASLIPFNNKKLDSHSFVKHISNNYAINPAGLFGKMRVDRLVKKKLELFVEKSFFQKLLNNLKFFLYSLIRINFKNFKKLI